MIKWFSGNGQLKLSNLCVAPGGEVCPGVRLSRNEFGKAVQMTLVAIVVTWLDVHQDLTVRQPFPDGGNNLMTQVVARLYGVFPRNHQVQINVPGTPGLSCTQLVVLNKGLCIIMQNRLYDHFLVFEKFGVKTLWLG
jgi:hypothetical protein